MNATKCLVQGSQNEACHPAKQGKVTMGNMVLQPRMDGLTKANELTTRATKTVTRICAPVPQHAAKAVVPLAGGKNTCWSISFQPSCFCQKAGQQRRQQQQQQLRHFWSYTSFTAKARQANKMSLRLMENHRKPSKVTGRFVFHIEISIPTISPI